MVIQQSEGILSYIFRGGKSFFGFIFQKWNWSLMMMVVIIFLISLLSATMRQEGVDNKMKYALIETGKTLLGADNQIQEDTDHLFKDSPSLIQIYMSSQWFQPKLLALWEIIKVSFSILFSLLFLYYFLRLVIAGVKLVVGESELGVSIIIASVFILLIMIITNMTFILVQTADTGEVPDININTLFIPFKGVYYFGKTLLDYGLEPAYNLVEVDIPKYDGEYTSSLFGNETKNTTSD